MKRFSDYSTQNPTDIQFNTSVVWFLDYLASSLEKLEARVDELQRANNGFTEGDFKECIDELTSVWINSETRNCEGKKKDGTTVQIFPKSLGHAVLAHFILQSNPTGPKAGKE